MRKALLTTALLCLPATAQAVTRVCVSVDVKSWSQEVGATQAESSKGSARVLAEGDVSPRASMWRSGLLGQVPEAGQAEPTPGEGESEPNQPTAIVESTPEPLPPIPSVKAAAGARQEASEARRAAPDRPQNAPDPAVFEVDPAKYLKRMLEYEVTHEREFTTVDKGCTEIISVELYALEHGWTVFARYSGHAREEKVNRVLLDEFSELAQRLARALLRDTPISQTMTRENVLRADSEGRLRTVTGSRHLQFGMGTAVRVGKLSTERGQSEPAEARWRLLTPLMLQLGYRRKLKSWGLDAFTRVLLGTSTKGARGNELGGHVDYTASLIGGLHFMRYADASALNSLYVGGGASFEFAMFQGIRPLDDRERGSRDTLYGGGLNFDLLVGYEFMRTSSVHFYTQLEATAPAYVIDTEKGESEVDTYLPGGLAQIGIVF